MKKGFSPTLPVALPLCLLTILFCGSSAIADGSRIKIPFNGDIISVDVDADTKQLEFFTTSEGNVTSTMTAELVGPGGTKAVVEAKVLKGDLGKALDSKAGWFPIGLKSIASQKVSDNSGDTTDANCGGLSKQVINRLIAAYSQAGVRFTAEQICEIHGQLAKGEQELGTGYTAPTRIDLGQTGSLGFLQKNACAPKNLKTIVRVRVDLSKVPQAQLDANPSVGVGLREFEFSGNRAASIKPTSDGKFAPQPLLLMAALGGLGGNGESVRVVNWKQNKPSKPLVLKVADYVYFRGMVLSRIVASKALNGGKATFELTNGQRIYGVCLNRTKTRQRVNGYPG